MVQNRRVQQLCFRCYDAVNNKKRLRILLALLGKPPMLAEDLRESLSMSEGVLDYHLSVLDKAEIVERRFLKKLEYCRLRGDGEEILNRLHVDKDKALHALHLELAKEAFKSTKELLEDAYGSRDKWIAVLGAFDTWPYMDYAGTQLADMGYTVFTSRRNYRKIVNNLSQEVGPDPNQPMGKFLERMISRCEKAVIVYSVSAGHYIETDWCSRMGKPTLGLSFVRDVLPSGKRCKDLKVEPTEAYSVCTGTGTAWNCLSRQECPFKRQGISLNVVEYYIRSDSMNLVAVSKILEVRKVFEDWLSGKLVSRTT